MAIPQDIKDSGLVPPESYLQKHYKMMALIAGIIIVTPVILYGAYWSYQQLRSANSPEEMVMPPAPAPSPASAALKTEAALRDEQRLNDVKTLQAALTAHFTAKQSYPQNLSELTSSSSLPVIPTDPKTKQAYLYIPVGTPAMDFSLSFVLETPVSNLEKGIHEISPGHFLPVDILQQQDSVVKGITKIAPTPDLKLTDLSAKAFYPAETVVLHATSQASLDYVVLTTGNLKLTDKNKPFSFEFSAPAAEGKYEVSVYGFTASGANLKQTTTLVVKARR